MSVTDGEGGYELTGRPCDKDKNGNYGKERAVVNSVILSYGHAAKNAYVFDSAERIDQVKKTARVKCRHIGILSCACRNGQT